MKTEEETQTLPETSVSAVSVPTLKFYALGGLGEIGMNCYILESGKDLIIIDCGQMAPEEEMLGIDLVIPDFSQILTRKEDVRGIVLTHAHEDHIGALPYLLPEISAPVYGSPLTLGILNFKLKEYDLLERTQLYELEPRIPVELGCFKVIPYTVSHSVADAFGLIVETPLGNMVFSGDYKFDPNPHPGERFDYATVSQYGDMGILALFGDSTNVDRKGATPSESEVVLELDRLFHEARQTLVVSCFASSIHRIKTILSLAQKHGRYVFPAGLNMVRNIQIGRELGYIEADDSLFRDVRKLTSTSPHKRLLLSTGSQGEPLSVMSRLALDDYKWLNLEKGDTVIISARMIPGNEKGILRMINHFARRGARVHYEWVDKVHASGHAYRDDVKNLIQLTRPLYLIPIHGEYRHLQEHKNLGIEMGIPEDDIFVIEDGNVIEFSSEGVRRAGDVLTGHVLVDGKGVGDIGEVVLRDRMHLSQHGMLIAILAIDSTTGDLAAGPYIITRGFVFVDESEDLLEEAAAIVKEAFEEFGPESREDWGVVKTAVRKALKKFIKKRTARFPMILPVVLEI